MTLHHDTCAGIHDNAGAGVEFARRLHRTNHKLF